MRLFRKRPSPTDPQNATHDAIAQGCPVASLWYVTRMADGDLSVNRYWQERAQAVLLVHVMSELEK
jgi:hypothetical protein